MKMKELELYAQLADFAIGCCNSAHDINNTLAVLLGYNEQLEYMLEEDRITKDELIEINKRFYYAIDKLNIESKKIGANRRKVSFENEIDDISDRFHRFLKIVQPRLKEWNISSIMLSSDIAKCEFNNSRLNIFFCEFFSLVFGQNQPKELSTVEFSTSMEDNQFCIHWECDFNCSISDSLLYDEKTVKFMQNDNKYSAIIPCKIITDKSESAA